MIRFRPTEFTASDVASMLATLDVVTPYLDRETGRYYFRLSDTSASPFPDIFVAAGAEGEAFARRAAAEAVTALPQLRARVVGLPDEPGYSDEYRVSHLDVGRGEIDAADIGSVNALWHDVFRKDDVGRWRPVGDASAAIEVSGGGGLGSESALGAERRPAGPSAAADPARLCGPGR